MKFRTKKIGYWLDRFGKVVEDYEFDERTKEEPLFYVEPMTPKERIRNIEKCEYKEWDRGQRFEKTDFYKVKLHRIFKTITDWNDQVENEDGPMECNQHNKELLYAHETAVIDAVLEGADRLAEGIAADAEEQEKNSEAGPSGPANQTEE
jgi:hypothetical protein